MYLRAAVIHCPPDRARHRPAARCDTEQVLDNRPQADRILVAQLMGTAIVWARAGYVISRSISSSAALMSATA